MGGGVTLRNSVVVFGVVLVLVVIYLSTSSSQENAETKLYFNIQTDYPNSRTLVQMQQLNLTTPVEIIHAGEEYEIVFTVESNEKIRKNYELIIDSSIYSDTLRLTLNPGEKREFTLNIKANESQKWTISNIHVQELNDHIDITQNSWLADKKEFLIIANEGSLPAIVTDNYHLPISSYIDEFGRIYHVDLSLTELRQNPFTKSYFQVTTEQFKKIEKNDHIQLFVENEQLVLIANETTTDYVSKEEKFSILLYQLNEDEKTYGENPSEISFSYLIQ